MSLFPLSVSSNKRYPITPDGVPFPLLLDSTWWAVFNLNSTDQNTYFTDRVAKGFTATLLTAIEHNGTLNKPPLDFGSNLPFTKTLDGSTYTGSPNGTTTVSGNNGQYTADPYSNINNQAPDFTFPNTTYWNNIVTFLSLVRSYNMVAVMFPAYVGFAGGQEGWMAEMVAIDAVTGAGGQTGQSFADPSKSKLWNYGAWLANFFINVDNIIWIHGGDYGSGGSSGTFTTPQKTAVSNLYAGMLSVSNQKSTLHSAHWSRPSLSSDVTLAAGSFNLESVYSGDAPAQNVFSAYGNTPLAPVFGIEDRYEQASAATTPYRKYFFQQIASGAVGYPYGLDSTPPIYEFQSGWQSLLSTQGSNDASRLNTFIKGIKWYNLTPSGLLGIKTLITAGGGTQNPQSTDFIAASASVDGTLLVAYVPDAHSGSFTVDLTAMSSAHIAKWFDPTNATYTTIGTFSNNGTLTLNVPGTNSAGDHDWILLLQVPSRLPSVSFPLIFQNF